MQFSGILRRKKQGLTAHIGASNSAILLAAGRNPPVAEASRLPAPQNSIHCPTVAASFQAPSPSLPHPKHIQHSTSLLRVSVPSCETIFHVDSGAPPAPSALRATSLCARVQNGYKPSPFFHLPSSNIQQTLHPTRSSGLITPLPSSTA
jgi:hypothetical protein